MLVFIHAFPVLQEIISLLRIHVSANANLDSTLPFILARNVYLPVSNAHLNSLALLVKVDFIYMAVLV